MSHLSICVLCGDESKTDQVHPAVWFDLNRHEPDSIRQTLKDYGADPQLAKIVDCRGFCNYLPKDIEEACDLSEECLSLENRSLWPFFLNCYRNPPENLAKLTISDLERAFRGFYKSTGDYVRRAAIEHEHIEEDSPLFPFIDWNRYGDNQEDKGRIASIFEPISGSMAVFDLFVFDRSDEQFDVDENGEVA